ncbi:MAG: general secretion pathway protein A [Bacteroidia bacterium]|jgi:general secretion pathway protein A
MYHQYFGLTEAPFSIAVNPRYLFMSPRHRDALAHLLYGVGAGGGFILLTGEVGTGKTTINRCLLEQLPQDTDIAIILTPALDAKELLASACDELGISYDGATPTLKTLTDQLHRYLLENHQRGRKTVLLIDEAQHLDFEVLEQIRLLTNLETNSEKLLQIILIGQPELAEQLARPELRQLNQRITARYNLESLNAEETAAYIRHRLQVAGMSPDREIFPARVVRGIYRTTRGIPRLINVLCDRMLLGAYGRNKGRIDMAMLRQAVREVMGETGSANRGRQYVAVVCACLLVVLAAVAVWRLLPAVQQVSVTTTAPARPGVFPANTRPPMAESIQTEAAVVARMDEAASIAQIAPTPVEQAAMAELPLAPVTTPSALQATDQGMRILWSLTASGTAPAQLCPRTAYNGFACVQGQANTWDDLSFYNRPLALQMVTPERFAAEVLLLSIDGVQARVWREDGVQLLPLAELANGWTGGYRYLWYVPRGFTQPLVPGDDSATVAEVASLFAWLDDMEPPLTETIFNELLETRVRLFQREQGLIEDGIVGRQTLLKLNSALGLDVTSQAAEEKLTATLRAGESE